MSAAVEYAIEKRVFVKHDLTLLRARSIIGDDPPSVKEWGDALIALREAHMDVAMAELAVAMQTDKENAP